MSTAVAAILGLAYVIGAFITRKRPIVLNYSASGGGAVVQVVH